MLYLIKEYGKNNKEYLKIGKADNIDKRLQQYNTNCAEFELIDVFEGSIPEEKLLHSLLSKYKIKGEWMEYNNEILLLWKLYKEIRPKIEETILENEHIKYNKQIEYYENKLKKFKEKEILLTEYKILEEKISNISDIYSESLDLLKFSFKIIPLEYRKKIKNKYKGKLKYFEFKDEI